MHISSSIRVRSVLGQFWNSFGSCTYRVRSGLDLFLSQVWDSFGTVLGQFWDSFGTVLVQFRVMHISS